MMNTTLNQSMHHGGGTGGGLQGYYFPKLSAAEIISVLKELGFSISKEVLQQPENHKEIIKSLLENLSMNLLGLQSEELCQANFHGLQAITFHSLHEDSIPQLHGIRAIQKLMEICEITDFSLKDLFSPSPGRLNRQLSGILNFAKFREERVHLLFELNGQTQVYLDQLQEQTAKNESCNNRLLLLREQTKEDCEIVRNLQNDCSSFENKIEDLKSEQTSDENTIIALNNEINNLENAVSEYYYNLEDLSSQQKRFSQQVVTSPEKFRKQILDVGQSLQHEQKDVKNAEKRVRELSSWLVNVEEANGEILLALESIQDVRSEVEKQKNMINDLDTVKQEVEHGRKVLSELSLNTQQRKRQVERTEEKYNQLKQQYSIRTEETKKTIDDLHKQLVEAESFRVQVSD
jgi:kinetochore protein Nuf2